MPIYEYECERCHHTMEALQKVSDDPLLTCPSCNESSLKKKISAAGFRLKGSGWYETDFKTGNKKNIAGASSDGSSGGKSETSKSSASSAPTSSSSS